MTEIITWLLRLLMAYGLLRWLLAQPLPVRVGLTPQGFISAQLRGWRVEGGGWGVKGGGWGSDGVMG